MLIHQSEICFLCHGYRIPTPYRIRSALDSFSRFKSVMVDKNFTINKKLCIVFAFLFPLSLLAVEVQPTSQGKPKHE